MAATTNPPTTPSADRLERCNVLISETSFGVKLARRYGRAMNGKSARLPMECLNRCSPSSHGKRRRHSVGASGDRERLAVNEDPVEPVDDHPQAQADVADLDVVLCLVGLGEQSGGQRADVGEHCDLSGEHLERD